MTAAFLADDLTGHLLTLLWLLAVVWVYKMIDRGHVVKRRLRVKYIIKTQGCHRQLTLRAGDRLEEVTIKAVFTVAV